MNTLNDLRKPFADPAIRERHFQVMKRHGLRKICRMSTQALRSGDQKMNKMKPCLLGALRPLKDTGQHTEDAHRMREEF